MAVTEKRKLNSGVSAYGDYVQSLRQLAVEPIAVADWQGRVVAALNGQASEELRRVVPLNTRRQFGAFFTSSQLAERLIACCPQFQPNVVIYDPTVGIGDLLLSAASRLPLGRTVSDTLLQWGRRLAGTDLHPEFVRGAKARLILLARQRHGAQATRVSSATDFFPGIRVADGLSQVAAYERATHLFLNPPFGVVDAPATCKWAGGRITAAALFVATAFERVRPGTELLAILPDVLRSGSFTAQWRQWIEQLADIKLVEPYGIFDDSADVDVFLLRAVRRTKNRMTPSHRWIKVSKDKATTVGDFFYVRVGRVVPHRDPEAGNEFPYIHPRCIPTWKTVRAFSEKRRYKGMVYKAPFVVIRRTSRPGHPYRAAATIIAGNTSVAVENHLIVCEPKDGTLKSCRHLMCKLKTKAVNEFLDARIRCRHLTVAAVAAIPFNRNES